MTIIDYKLYGTVFTSCGLISLSGIIPVIFFKNKFKNIKSIENSTLLKYLLHFSIGTLLYDSLCHLLPEAISINLNYTAVMLRTIYGILLFYIIEKTSLLSHNLPEYSISLKNDNLNNLDENGNFIKQNSLNKNLQIYKNNLTAKLNLLANAMDNFIHGLSVGSSFLVSYNTGILASFGILLHEIPHEFGDFAILLKSGKSVYQCGVAQLTTSVTSFIGGMAALCMCNKYQNEALNWLLPISCGGFIFIALGAISNHNQDSKSNIHVCLYETLSLLLGVLVMYLTMQYFC